MKTAIFLATALAAASALAQPQQAAPPPAPQRGAPSGGRMLDPNQLICRSQSVVGSRLARARVCVTRQQWLEQQQQDRLLAEQAQTRRIWCGGGVCPTG
jgi:invasion protein IalB